MTTIKKINKTILFLHGLGSSGADWILQKEALSSEFTILTPNLPRSATIAGTAAFLADLLEDSVYVVGLSFGGMVAQQLALDFPHKVKKLILINTSCHMQDHLRSVGIKLLPMSVVAKIISWLCFPSDSNLRTLCEESILRWSKADFLHLYKEIAKFNVENRLHEIACPTLILTGSRDLLISPAHSEKIKKLIPHASQVIIEDAGHALPIDHPGECNSAICSFLENEKYP